MPATNTCEKTSVHLATNLDAGSVTAVYQQLLSLLDKVETSEAEVFLDLAGIDEDVSPLSLQLLVSATKSFPSERLSLGPRVVAALSALEQSKEI